MFQTDLYEVEVVLPRCRHGVIVCFRRTLVWLKLLDVLVLEYDLGGFRRTLAGLKYPRTPGHIIYNRLKLCIRGGAWGHEYVCRTRFQNQYKRTCYLLQPPRRRLL